MLAATILALANLPAHAPFNISNVGISVGSSVIVNNSVSSPFTDPYPVGTKLSLVNPNDANFVPGANAAIVAGTYISTAAPLTMRWSSRSENEMQAGSSTFNNLPAGSQYLASDVLQLQGQGAGADFVLEMDYNNEVENPSEAAYDASIGDLYLAKLAAPGIGVNTWENAAVANIQNQIQIQVGNKYVYQTLPAVGPYSYRGNGSDNASIPYGTSPAAPSNLPYLGSFQSFLNSSHASGANTFYFYEHSLDQLRGSWGVDTSTDTVWAVLDAGSGVFAVVPEPASIRLAVAGLMTLAIGVWWRRRSRIKVAKSVNLQGLTTKARKSVKAAAA